MFGVYTDSTGINNVIGSSLNDWCYFRPIGTSDGILLGIKLAFNFHDNTIDAESL